MQVTSFHITSRCYYMLGIVILCVISCDMMVWLPKINLNLTYDSNHPLLVGSEDDDPAVFANCDDLRTAAHNTSTGGVVTRVTMRSCPTLRNRHRLQSR